jgi:hypothetical protein
MITAVAAPADGDFCGEAFSSISLSSPTALSKTLIAALLALFPVWCQGRCNREPVGRRKREPAIRMKY